MSQKQEKGRGLRQILEIFRSQAGVWFQSEATEESKGDLTQVTFF